MLLLFFLFISAFSDAITINSYFSLVAIFSTKNLFYLLTVQFKSFPLTSFSICLLRHRRHDQLLDCFIFIFRIITSIEREVRFMIECKYERKGGLTTDDDDALNHKFHSECEVVVPVIQWTLLICLRNNKFQLHHFFILMENNGVIKSRTKFSVFTGDVAFKREKVYNFSILIWICYKIYFLVKIRLLTLHLFLTHPSLTGFQLQIF